MYWVEKLENESIIHVKEQKQSGAELTNMHMISPIKINGTTHLGTVTWMSVCRIKPNNKHQFLKKIESVL